MARLVTADFSNNAEPCVLRYTTVDNQKLRLRSFAFDKGIKSHIYKNGEGLIIFESVVTAIKYRAFENYKSLYSIIIPGGVESISFNAFYGCQNLTKITLPDSISVIQTRAFENCIALNEIKLPQKLSTISEHLLAGCKSLKSIHIPDNVNYIGDYAFRGCSSMINIDIPKTVSFIGEDIFQDCCNLERVEFESYTPPLTKKCIAPLLEKNSSGKIYVYNECIGIYKDVFEEDAHHIFRNDKSINQSETSIIHYETNNRCIIDTTKLLIKSNTYNEHEGTMTIYGTLNAIPSHAFENCVNLTKITLPNTITAIGERAFYNCPNLQSFTALLATPDKRCLITNGALVAFAPANMKKYRIPRGVRTIADSVFCGCNKLKRIQIPLGISSIGASCFEDCTSLTHVWVPCGVEEIKHSAFEGCLNLRWIRFPKSLRILASAGLYNCRNLKTVFIPNDFNFDCNIGIKKDIGSDTKIRRMDIIGWSIIIISIIALISVSLSLIALLLFEIF